MDIECKLKREGGTRVHIGATEYHFAPIDDGANVSIVTIEAHIDRFLSIPEAYKEYSRKADKADASSAQSEGLDAVAVGVGTVDNSEERAALVSDYEAKFGKKPHGKWSAAKIREALAADA